MKLLGGVVSSGSSILSDSDGQGPFFSTAASCGWVQLSPVPTQPIRSVQTPLPRPDLVTVAICRRGEAEIARCPAAAASSEPNSRKAQHKTSGSSWERVSTHLAWRHAPRLALTPFLIGQLHSTSHIDVCQLQTLALLDRPRDLLPVAAPFPIFV